jgi:nicotinamide-nucleotide amidase
MMGFWTLNGDVGDLAPIQHVLKGLEEYDMARVLGVPQEAISVEPTDGLDVIPGGTDQDQLGLSYHELDKVIVRLLQEDHDGSVAPDEALCKRISGELGMDLNDVKSTAHRMSMTHFKRNWPRTLKRDEIGLPSIDEIRL